jgi:hypothetical protein
MFFVKPIPKELILKHFPNMKVEPGWFGALTFHDPASGLRGYTGRRTIDFKAKDPAIEEAAYLPFSRLFMEAYISADAVEEDLREDTAEALAMMWRLKEKWHSRKFWSPVNEKAKKETRITRERIIWHLDSLGLKSIRRRFPRGYVITMASGRQIEVGPTWIKFRRSPTSPMQGESERDLAELRFECLRMASRVWGGIRFPALEGQELVEVSAAAEACGVLVKDDRIAIFRHFGPDATTRYTSGGFTITLPNRGYVRFEGGRIEKVCGDLFRPALAMAHEVTPGGVVVRGKADLLVMATQEARAMGIPVIPESELSLLMTITANLSLWTCMALGFWWLDGWPGILDGFVGGYVLFASILCLFHKQIQRLARQKGLEIVGFTTAAPIRKASLDEARRKQML